MYSEDSYVNVELAAEAATKADRLARTLADQMLGDWAERAIGEVEADERPRLPLSREAVNAVLYAYASGVRSDVLARATRAAEDAWAYKYGTEADITWKLKCTPSSDGSIVFDRK